MHEKIVSAAISPEMFRGTRVLVAEDMKVNMMLITRILQKHGCEVFPATNGLEVIDMLGKEGYDIVFMDCQMPLMDGFEATAAYGMMRTVQESMLYYPDCRCHDSRSGEMPECGYGLLSQ